MSCFLCLPSRPCIHAVVGRFPVTLLRRSQSRSGADKVHHVCCCEAKRQSSPLRRTANYPATIWTDDFVQSLEIDFTEEAYGNETAKLKEEVRCLMAEKKELVEQLELVDTLEQLGVAYHFEKEISEVLITLSRSMDEIRTVLQHDLHATSLLFRLLRGHRLFVPQDVFENFKDEKGGFKAYLCHDTRGMLSLYEASYLSIEGENILDEARDFTTTYLIQQLNENSLEPCLKDHVAHALELPLHRRLQRLHTSWFISVYERKENISHVLLKLGKLDYNMVQSTYKSEIKKLSRWWSDLGLGELSFARDRWMENYVWGLGWMSDPQFGSSRMIIAKVSSLITPTDDIYDIYGSLDELELFTGAVERWDVSGMDELPEYMKPCLLAIFNTTNQTAYDILKEKGVDTIYYLKKAWVNFCRAQLIEAKWYYKGYIPTLKEYLDNAWISVSGPLILIHIYIHMSETITKEALECLDAGPNILRHSCTLLRLLDDEGTSTDELSRGDVHKSIECYMHEHGVSEAVARENIRGLIDSVWKKMTGACLARTPFEESFVTIIVNTVRIAQWFYLYGDGYGKPTRESTDQILSLVVEPMPL